MDDQMTKTKFIAICMILVVLCMCVEEEAETPTATTEGPTITPSPTTPAPTTTSAPAEFEITDLRVIPENPKVGDTLIILVDVQNKGDTSGRYTVLVTIGSKSKTQNIELEGKSSKTVEFQDTTDTEGDIEIKAGNLTKTISVVALETPPPTILILVNESIYPQIEENLTVFEQDLNNDGYQVQIATVSNQISPPEIKGLIQSYYGENNLIGTILVGNIKAPYFESRTGDYSNPNALKIWISLDATDMYYMDLDGEWENVTDPDFCEDAPPNVIECHTYPSCQRFKNEYLVYLDEDKEWDYSTIENKEQYKAEIWVSRIMGHNLDIPNKNEVQIINDFFESDHKYRTGQYAISDKAYLLNEGSGYNDQGMDYSEIFDSVIKEEEVTVNDFITCLEDPAGSKLMYVSAHGSPQAHFWHDGSLRTDKLIDLKKNSIFYILNSCSVCRRDQYVSSPNDPNYLGGLYVFDKTEVNGDYGLGAIGFTGVGGFNNLKFFTDYLNSHETPIYGDAFKYWFNRNLMINFGMCNYVFLGDPTIGPL